MATQAEPMDAAASTGNEPAEPERGGAPSESVAPSSAYISSEADLIAFTRLPLEERFLTSQLRGVLAESALTGRIRYKWPLLRPLVDFVLEQVLTAYDAETRVEVGPPGPDSVSETIERFQKLLSAFSDAPWTFQRLCEILLEPKRQYSRLSKLVLAIEKCLLVTTEQPPTDPDQLPPPPLCSSLGPVNTNPAPVYTNAHHGSHAGHGAGPSGSADDSAGFTNSLLDVRHHPPHHLHHHGNHVGTPEHIEEDHWPEGLPEGKGPFKAGGVGVGLHGSLRPVGGPAGSGHGAPSGAASTSGSGNGSPGGGAAVHDAHGHNQQGGGSGNPPVAGAAVVAPPVAASGSQAILNALGAVGTNCSGGATTVTSNASSANHRGVTSGTAAAPLADGTGLDAMDVDGTAGPARVSDRKAAGNVNAPCLKTDGSGHQHQQRLHAKGGIEDANRQGAEGPDGTLQSPVAVLKPVGGAAARGNDGEGAAQGGLEIGEGPSTEEQGPGEARVAGESGTDPGGALATVLLGERKGKVAEADVGTTPVAPVGIPPPVG
ncbi:hypothetical protein VaNZ11_006792 [Volvox africanus]|uniref:Serine/threonine-protein phosphatase 4 regulatory subunit 2 n=1 Tax=Volvox africanus TaxID=51714 RepID=A0ABQ5S288_9CHLO|nr:hypothetical protein VaNZ11_006792 [Volvox africanus]